MEDAGYIKNTGLRGVTVADTRISYIDGEKGVLIYRGYRIEELAEKSSFAENAYLLLNGSLPDAKTLEDFEQRLTASRNIPEFIHESYGIWPRTSNPMDVLQASIPLLASSDHELKEESRPANVRKAMRIIARMPSLIAAWHRIRNGQAPLPADDRLSHAENFLWQLTGQKPDKEVARCLEVALILQADHTFNASTFACREVVSTRAHMYAGVAAGVGALSGSLHGAANAMVMGMLFDMMAKGMSAEDVSRWVKEKLDRGERIMGMGHPVYKTIDPRSEILKELCRRMADYTGLEDWFKFLKMLENECIREFERRGKKKIKANVDFFSGLLYAMMGIPLDLMTPVFAMAIAVGWCAHIIEEKFAEAQAKPILYRPQSEYIGNYCGQIGCAYQPLEKR